MSAKWILVVGAAVVAFASAFATLGYLGIMSDEINSRRAPDDRIVEVPGPSWEFFSLMNAYRQRCPEGRLHVRAWVALSIYIVSALIAMASLSMTGR